MYKTGAVIYTDISGDYTTTFPNNPELAKIPQYNDIAITGICKAKSFVGLGTILQITTYDTALLVKMPGDLLVFDSNDLCRSYGEI